MLKKTLFSYVLGVLIILYPLFSNVYSKNIQKNVINDYEKTVVHRDKERNEKKLREMKDHNISLFNQPTTLEGTNFNIDAESGEGSKKLGEVLGVIEIPVIGVELPIYYGTNEYQISKGAGIMENTSLPGGGESSHSVITSHRGLPTAKLFTDLPKLVEGDTFFVRSAGETFAYEVDKITVIKPDDFSQLSIIKGKDMVTLLTCTPYLINTHRLLVRGQRVNYSDSLKIEAQNLGLRKRIKSILTWFSLIIIFITLIYSFKRFIGKRKRNKRLNKKVYRRKQNNYFVPQKSNRSKNSR